MKYSLHISAFILLTLCSGGALFADSKQQELELQKKLEEQKKASDKQLAEHKKIEAEARKREVNAFRKRSKYREYRRSFLASAFVPGLGQYFLGQKPKAYGIFGGFVLFSAGFYLSLKDWQDAQNEFNDTTLPTATIGLNPSGETLAANSLIFEERSARLNSTRQSLEISFILLAGLYAYNIYDIMQNNPLKVDGDKKKAAGRRSRPRVLFSMTPAGRKGRAKTGASWRLGLQMAF